MLKCKILSYKRMLNILSTYDKYFLQDLTIEYYYSTFIHKQHLWPIQRSLNSSISPPVMGNQPCSLPANEASTGYSLNCRTETVSFSYSYHSSMAGNILDNIGRNIYIKRNILDIIGRDVDLRQRICSDHSYK